jgi:DNA primase
MINGKYVYLTSRSIGTEIDVKWIDLSMRKRIFNEDVIDGNSTVFMCEGIPDSLSMIAHGYRNTIGILGSGVFKTEYVDRLKGKKVIICYDNDFSGRDNSKRISRILRTSGNEVMSIELPEEQDVSEFFAAGNERVKVIPIENIKDDEKELTLNRAEPNLLVFNYSHYEVNVSDIIPRKGSLKATVSINNEKKLVASSNFDLYSMRSRSTYAKEMIGYAKDVTLIEAKSLLMDLSNAVKQSLKIKR